MQDEEDTKRFIKEVRIMNELKHPNIVKFRRVCFAPCALMMEYMCFSFLPFRSGSDISVSSLQDFLLCINDQDCFGFEDFFSKRTLLSYRCTREVEVGKMTN